MSKILIKTMTKHQHIINIRKRNRQSSISRKFRTARKKAIADRR